MRILHTGDWHLGKNLEGKSRLEEQEEFLKDFIDIVEKENIDLVIIAGDVYDTSNPPAKAEKLFYDTLKKISQSGERLTLVISGNHDNPERLIAAGPLAMEHGIIMVGTPKTVVQTGEYGKHKVINSGEGFIEIEINGEKAVILTVPYPSEKRLNEVIYEEMDSEEEKLKSYGDKIKALFDNLKSNFREDTINLVTSHLFAMGSEEGGSERSIQLGGSFIVSGECFPEEAQYIALGHVHKPQIVPGTNKKARYSGSPLHYNRKEINYKKSCYVVDVKAGEEAKVKDVLFKVYKPIEVWKCNSIEEAIKKCEEEGHKSSYVYLEIDTDRFIREDETKLMHSKKEDIIAIIPKIKGNEEEEDLGTIAEKPVEQIFREFYKKEKGVEPQDDVINLFLNLMGREELEDETN